MMSLEEFSVLVCLFFFIFQQKKLTLIKTDHLLDVGYDVQDGIYQWQQMLDGAIKRAKSPSIIQAATSALGLTFFFHFFLLIFFLLRSFCDDLSWDTSPNSRVYYI